jgi:TolA-binding protein
MDSSCRSPPRQILVLKQPMTTAKSKRKSRASVTQSDVVEQTQRQLEREAEYQEKAADCELDLARLFIRHEKYAIARRRLDHILSQFPQSTAAKEADQLLQGLATSD